MYIGVIGDPSILAMLFWCDEGLVFEMLHLENV